MNEIKTNIKININVEAVRAAAKNAETMDKVVFEIPVVNPKKLTLDGTIFGFTTSPLNDKVEVVKPSTLRYVAIKRININTLDGTITPDAITVNGTIDILKESSKINRLSEVFVTDESVARELAKILTENELDRAQEIAEDAIKAERFLQEQLDKNRF